MVINHRLRRALEMSQYLDSGMSNILYLVMINLFSILLDVTTVEPLPFWREHQGRFPAIASLARDVLSIPATGAGVERLSNTARDICHYRRGRMKSKTIEELMMFLCTTKFDLEVEEGKQLEKLYSLEEVEALKEEREEKPDDIDRISISDTEEGDEDEPLDLIDVQDETVEKGPGTFDPDLPE